MLLLLKQREQSINQEELSLKKRTSQRIPIVHYYTATVPSV